MLRIKLISITIASGILLLIVLSLGAQNLEDRHVLNLGSAKTVPLPTGFLVGISLITGFISGGSATALLIRDDIQK